MSTLLARNQKTIGTWHPETLFHGKESGIRIRMTDDRVVDIRKGTVFTIANPRNPSTPFILKATWMSNNGRESPHHPIGIGYDEWIPAGASGGGKWLDSSLPSVLGVWPGCAPHCTAHLDLATITLCANPDGSPVPSYSPPPPTRESLGKELLDALSVGQEKEALRLLDAGADVHRMYKSDKNTPLHWACAWNLVSVGLRLIAAGAKHDLSNKNFKCPLELCRDVETRRILQEALPKPAPVSAPVPVPASAPVSASAPPKEERVPTKRELILAALRA